MTVIFTVLSAFALGYLLRRRATAIVTYLALDALVFSYQSVGVLLSWLSDEKPIAFGPAPTGFPITYSRSEYLGYGVVNLIVLVAGVGLVVFGTWVAARRSARRTAVAVA